MRKQFIKVKLIEAGVKHEALLNVDAIIAVATLPGETTTRVISKDEMELQIDGVAEDIFKEFTVNA